MQATLYGIDGQKSPAYSTGDCIQYFVITYNEKYYVKEYIYI